MGYVSSVKPAAPERDAAAALRGAFTPHREASHRNPKISELVARQVVTHIADLDIPDGTRLPNERDLAEMLGVGRTSLREGLRLLETRGVITIHPGPNGGPVVRRLQQDGLSEGLTLLLQLNASTLGDMFEARAQLEPQIASLAAVRVTDAELDAIEERCQAVEAAVEDPSAFLAQDFQFHTTIARATNNVSLGAFLSSLMRVTHQALLKGRLYPEPKPVVRAHYRILEALRQRDPEKAHAAMHDHVSGTIRYPGRSRKALLATPVRWEMPTRLPDDHR
jgi:DNA-binding FadR family transcriptional regulator